MFNYFAFIYLYIFLFYVQFFVNVQISVVNDSSEIINLDLKKTVPNSKVSFSQSEALIQIYEYLFRPLHQIFWSQDIMKLIFCIFL